MSATTVEEALRYYQNRSIQALPWGWSWDGNYKDLSFGVSVNIRSPQGTLYPSLYLFATEQGKGHYSRWLSEQVPAVGYECQEVQAYLKQKGRPFVEVAPPMHWGPGLRVAHDIVRNYYGDGHAFRSQLPLINHIDEGLYILQERGAGQVAMQAFCLHPLLQGDKDLLANYKKSFAGVDPEALILAVEYRHVANAYLSKDKVRFPKAGVLPEVREMLVADKIQNKKDFQVYPSDVGNAEQLEGYIRRWFTSVGFAVSQYEKMANGIQRATGRPSI